MDVGTASLRSFLLAGGFKRAVFIGFYGVLCVCFFLNGFCGGFLWFLLWLLSLLCVEIMGGKRNSALWKRTSAPAVMGLLLNSWILSWYARYFGSSSDIEGFFEVRGDSFIFVL